MPLTGHCLCKAVTYSVDVEAPLLTGYDHCDDCQRQSGSTYCTCQFTPALYFEESHCISLRNIISQVGPANHVVALVAVVPKDKLTIKGPIKKWTGKGSSGNDVHRLFCSECGSPIAHDPDAAPEIIALKAGTFDSELKKNLKPVCVTLAVSCPDFELGQLPQVC